MYSLVHHGRRFVELQKCHSLRVSVQNGFAFSNSFSSATATDVRLRDGRKGNKCTVSYLVDSLGLSKKVAESISRIVGSEGKANPDSVLSLFRTYGFTDSQISSIITDYPLLLRADAEKSLGLKFKFLQSRGASSSELTEIVSTVPKILAKKEGKSISRYYDLVKEIIEADKSSKFQKLSLSLPQGSKQENKIRNISVLRELGMPQKLLFSLLVSGGGFVCGKEKFEESVKKVVEMGFDSTTAKFVEALRVIQGFSDKVIEEKVNACKRLGFVVEDVWAVFKKWPSFMKNSEKKIENSIETFIGLGFTRDEFAIILKRYPMCIGLSAESVKKKTEFLVKKMNWPLKNVVSTPAVLGLSMEKRIVPRCNVIRELMSKGLLGDRGRELQLPPMQYVLNMTNQLFLERYVMKHDDKELVAELMSIFTNGQVS